MARPKTNRLFRFEVSGLYTGANPRHVTSAIRRIMRAYERGEQVLVPGGMTLEICKVEELRGDEVRSLEFRPTETNPLPGEVLPHD